ncbi:hypothetical protein P170DRAFT_425786 [Aspergillus steynii IBT 23096]|uniref:GED domain-containing protein n=1 Tax=Aspergillus steynii IBT 23096 TaxID=1392250 RepID=A0A2I2G799_9EURO|nr:uncharacterized protein P170DRAFT_425786 [Aspergillus steynii IBT 23096]PLB48767.1 hypothetical protein P170DRAFT_425786 [Aspergillus steynii IBT 23096]
MNAELVDLGAERYSPAQIRIYLTRISTDFHNLVKAGVEGIYRSRDGFFHEINDQNEYHRLHAAVHMENGKFSNYMRIHGQKRRVVLSKHLSEIELKSGQLLVTAEDMSSWIKKLGRWADIARSYVDNIVGLVSWFVHSVSAFVIKDINVRENVLRRITVSMENNARAASSELAKLLEDEAGSPITYNYYYTDNIQKARNDWSRQDLGILLHNTINDDWNGRFHVSNSPDEISRLMMSLQNYGVIVNMEERACSEAQTDLAVYYKVAIKTFVDNVCRQVIERYIVAKLLTIFGLVTVSGFSEEDLYHLAAESPQLNRYF